MNPETAPETTLETASAPISASQETIPGISAPRHRPTSQFLRRLPRFTRAKRSHRPPLVLQERDQQLLRAVYEYRLVSTPQLILLFDQESRDGLYRRLQGLFHHGYVDRIGSNPNAPLVYALAQRGAETLGVTRRKELSDPYIAHQLMIGDFRLAMTRATKARGIGLSWRNVPADSPIKPDGFFGLQFPDRPEGRNRAFFFLEADRSTMTRERYVQKLVNYGRWYQRGGHAEKLGIKRFRVLTVTKSEERTRSLLEAATRCSEIDSALPMFWFCYAGRFRAGTSSEPIDPIWNVVGARGEFRGLLPTI